MTATTTITETTVLVDEHGNEWTLAEWTEHADAERITWHIRLDKKAILEGEAWEGGRVLLEPRPRVTQDRVDAILAEIREADDARSPETDPLSDLINRNPWPEVDDYATAALDDQYAVELVDGTVIRYEAGGWVAVGGRDR